ncbi:MAG: hydrogenase maturation protease [Gammaproteobacteria bacterium]|jgi:hydrogenase maturation protease
MNGPRNKVVVIALGSRFRGDDGVGPAVADKLNCGVSEYNIIEGCDDSMSILNAWENVALAVVIDAAVSGSPPGTVHRLEVDTEPLPRDIARCSSHGLGLAEAVELGKVMGRFPERLVVYAVEGQSFEPGAALSREVAAVTAAVAGNVAAEIAAMQTV